MNADRGAITNAELEKEMDGVMAASEDQAPELPKEGLQKKWAAGESLPWKGIWFEVSQVDKDMIVLVPKGTTWKRYKQLDKARQDALKGDK